MGAQELARFARQVAGETEPQEHDGAVDRIQSADLKRALFN